MLTVIITSGFVLYILKKEYAAVISEDTEHSLDEKNNRTFDEGV
jgi:hypothetical protein